MTCRIFLDQNLPLDITGVLRRFGHDALAVQDAQMLGAADDALLRFATEQGRVFLSADYRDFAQLSREWNESGRDFPGIVLIRLPRAEYSLGEIVSRIEQHITPDPARLQNSLTWLPPLR